MDRTYKVWEDGRWWCEGCEGRAMTERQVELVMARTGWSEAQTRTALERWKTEEARWTTEMLDEWL